MDKAEAREGARRLKEASIAAVVKYAPVGYESYVVRIWRAVEHGTQEHYFTSLTDVDNYLASKRFRQRAGRTYPPDARFFCDICGRSDLSEDDMNLCVAYGDLGETCINLRHVSAVAAIAEMRREHEAEQRLLRFPDAETAKAPR